MPAIRVLLIEDDYGAGDLLQAAMQPDYEVLRACNGLEGMRLALNGEPDLIVSDVMMPVMDGHEFMRRLRRFEGYERFPVIFTSSLSAAEDVRKGYDLGAALYLNKPLEPKRFRRNLDLFIEDRQITPTQKKRTVAEVMAALAAGTGEKPAPRRPGEDSSTRRMGESTPRTAPPRQASPSDSQVRRAGEAAPRPSDSQVRKSPSGGESSARFKVPLNPMQVMQAQRAQEPELPPRFRVMIIEHDPEALKGMSQGLEADFEVIPARDGMEAIERMVRYHPDIFIVDAQIPKLTANHLIAMIRKDTNFQRSPILYLSNKLDPHTTYQLERMGIKDFLPKPVTVSMIKGVIKKAVQERGLMMLQGRLPWQTVRMELGIAEGFKTAVFNPFMKGNSAAVIKDDGETTSSKRQHAHQQDAPEEGWRG